MKGNNFSRIYDLVTIDPLILLCILFRKSDVEIDKRHRETINGNWEREREKEKNLAKHRETRKLFGTFFEVGTGWYACEIAFRGI